MMLCQLFLCLLRHGCRFIVLQLGFEEFHNLGEMQVFLLELGVLVAKLDDHFFC